MKKLWIILIAFLSAIYCFSGCVHEDSYGTQSDVSNTTQSPSPDSEDDSSESGDTQTDGTDASGDSSTSTDESSDTTNEPGLDIVPPITNGGNFDGTV